MARCHPRHSATRETQAIGGGAAMSEDEKIEPLSQEEVQALLDNSPFIAS